MAEEIINIEIIEDVENINIVVDETIEEVTISIQEITNTSDLINDGKDGIHPFITIEDVPPLTGYATTSYVDTKDALKVDKVTGKGLSTNDFTNALKTAYDNAVSWIIAHLINYSNPHQTTAYQVGAYTTAQTDALLTGVNTDAVDKISVKLGVAINKGQAVYVSSATGTNMIVSKASNTTEATSSKTLGLLETTGVLNDQLKVITLGLFGGLNTSTATIGDPVWLGVNGNLIYGLANKPSAPAHLVSIGIVTRVSETVGEIFVKVQNGFELYEIHDVAIATPTNEDFLQYETSTSLWKNIQITASWLRSKLGITTLSGSNTGDQDLSGYVSKTAIETITGKKTLSPSVIASGAIAQGTILTPSLTAAANNDVLVGLDIAPAFVITGFTGITSAALRVGGNIIPSLQATHDLGTSALSFNKLNVYSIISPSTLSLYFSGGTLGFQLRQSTGNIILQNGGTFTDIASARLQVNSTTQGFLPPRMTNAQRTAITSPAIGLMVYCTDTTEGVYVYKSTGWVMLV